MTSPRLSERSGFGGFKVAHAILNSAKRLRRFARRRAGAVNGDGREAKRNKSRRPLAGSRWFMPDSLRPCTESKPTRRQPGEHCKAMRWRSHACDFSAPVRGVQPRTGFAFSGSLSRLRFLVGKMVGNGLRRPPRGVPERKFPSILPSNGLFNRNP